MCYQISTQQQILLDVVRSGGREERSSCNLNLNKNFELIFKIFHVDSYCMSSGGPANISFDTCCNGKNSDETATLGLKEEQQERQSVKSYQEKVSQTEGVVDDNNRQNQSMISEIQNGEASTATIKNKNDSSGSSSRSSKKIKGIKLNRINRVRQRLFYLEN